MRFRWSDGETGAITSAMDILVTGGAGFIGSHLVDRLVGDGHRVTVLDNLSTGKRANLHPSAVLVEGDVADAALVQSLVARAQAVFHLAAVASVEACTKDWLNAHRTNLTGSVTVFDAAAKAGGVPVIYASSAAVYGDNPKLPLAEDARLQPLSAYGLDKLSAERYAAIATGFHQVPTAGLRFFNVYGPRQDAASPYSGVISSFMVRARSGQPLTIFGDGAQTRDFIYVTDAVELLICAYRHLARHPEAVIINGCTGRETSLVQLADGISRVLVKPVTVTHGTARVGDIRHSLGATQHAQALLGFTARTSLADGLAQLASDA